MGIKVFVQNWVYWSEGIIPLRTIRKNNFKYLKFLWSVIIVLTFVAFCIHAAFLLVDYVRFDSRVDLKASHELTYIYYLPKVTFPAVTVCSINPFKQNKINQSSQLSQFMDAYNFILEKRQSLLKTNQSALRSFDDSNLDEFIRSKRQTCPTSSKANQYNTTFTYDIQSCNNVSVVKLYCADRSLGLQLNMSFELDTKLTKIMDASFYYCQSLYLCGNGDPCTIFANTMSVLKNINGCLTDQGLIEELQYPPDFFANNPANNMARQVGINCNFANRYSTYSYFAKPSNKYNGTYSSTSATQNGIGNINATIDNCDRSGTVLVRASIPANCTNNYINIISNVTQCMADYSCGDACVYGNCPFTKTPMEQCGNSAYYDLMCSIAVCNTTSSTEYSTTTELATTHELSTKTSQESTTSFEATTVIEKTTTEPKILSTSTELISTESSSFITSSSTLQSSTTTILTTESTSLSPSTLQSMTTTQTSSAYEPHPSTSTSVETSSPNTLLTSTSTSVSSTTQTLTSETTSESSTSLKTTETTNETSTTPTSTVINSTSESSTIITSASTLITSQTSVAKTLFTTPLTSLSSSSTLQPTTDRTTSLHSTASTLSALVTTPTTILTFTLPSSATSMSTQKTTPTTPEHLTSNKTPNLPFTTKFTTQKPLTSLATKKVASTSEVTLSTINPITTPSNALPSTSLQTVFAPTTQTSPFPITKTSNESLSLIASSTKLQLVETSVFPSSNLSSGVSTTPNLIVSSTLTTDLNVPLTSSTILSSPQTSTHQPITTKDAIMSTSTSSVLLPNSSVVISTSQSTTSSVATLRSSTITKDFGVQQTTLNSQATNNKPTNRPSLSTGTTNHALLTTKPQSSAYRTSFVSPASTTVVSSTTSHEITLRKIANLWGLSEYQNQPSFITHVRQALIEIAASLTSEERQELCYSLPELVSSCNIGKIPCDMDNDFSRVFDVDYGYCYTFNSDKIRDVYQSSQTGSLHGLRMILFTNPITYLKSTESKGFKIVLHDQAYNPFPNTEGYFGAVGESVRFTVEKDRYSRLNHPYNECDDLNSLKQRNQPFYYGGDYSIEGCLRSCFQQKMVNACACADSRFPYPKNDSFCSQTNLTNYECNQRYIETEGDYYFVDCDCANSCKQTEYSAQLWKASWPNGAFFYEQYCPSAELSSISCEENNSAEILVYYNRLRYSEYIERPQTTFVDLLSALGGATALWIGCCAIFVGELLLLFIQSILWCFCCKELPEVPSCRHLDYGDDARKDQWLKEGSSADLLSVQRPLHLENHMQEKLLDNDILFSEYHVMYKQIIPLHHIDHIPPTPVSSAPVSRVYID